MQSIHEQKLSAAYYSIHPRINNFKSRQQFISWATDGTQPNSLVSIISNRFHGANAQAMDLCLTRFDHAQPYSPENCTWKTRDEISSNRPTTRKIYYKNHSYTISEFCEKFGIKLTTMRSFVNRKGVDYITEADIDVLLAKQRAREMAKQNSELRRYEL